MENIFLTDKQVISIFKNHLKIESKVISINDLFSVRNKNRINPSPYYQRKYVWNSEKATYFIESVMLGTEIPPLVLFYGNEKVEVIDGKQRYETLQNFIDDKLTLINKGLMLLKKLEKKTYSKLDEDLQDRFSDTKVRLIEFRLVNEPKLEPIKEDLLKKEIFRRYNSGITPLKRSQVEKAMFIDDPLTQYLKKTFSEDIELYKEILELFFTKKMKDISNKTLLEDVMSKIRLLLVLHNIPIRYYSTLPSRKDIMNLFYSKFSDEVDDIVHYTNTFKKKINLLRKIRNVFIKNKIEYTNLIFECLFWSFQIIESEDIDLFSLYTEEFINELSEKIEQNLSVYKLESSHFYKEFNLRHKFTLSLYDLDINFSIYLDSYNVSEIRNNIDMEKENIDPGKNELFFLTKPNPSDITIESITSQMKKNKFLVRPAYQREEVMNRKKASALIESILLDIKLPPIFIYKNSSNIREVVDGQQRILTILGFIGEPYRDESGNYERSNKNNFKLSNLTILPELDERRFSDLDENQKDKILDFNLSVIEIDYSINHNFNPIDLFIRLNSKPYPIKENSFEMWNSYCDIDVIKSIKASSAEFEDWFYIKKASSNTRMENEELFTFLCYMDYKINLKNQEIKSVLDFHKRGDRINTRVSDKNEISKVLSIVSVNPDEKKLFITTINNIKAFIKKIQTLLLVDSASEYTAEYLSRKLDEMFVLRSRRRLLNFYFLWILINDFTIEMLKYNRHNIFQEICNIYKNIANVPDEDDEGVFFDLLSKFKEGYKKEPQKIELTDDEKKQLIVSQNNLCPICGSAILYSDQIKIDHIISLLSGGKDEKENLQIVHEHCLSKKSTRKVKQFISLNEIKLSQLIANGEDQNTEFKSTLSWNIDAQMKDKKIEKAVLKTIAGFNNKDGGVLLIGVTDEKDIIGLSYDYINAKLKNKDKLELHIRNLIRDNFIVETGNAYLSRTIQIKFVECKKNEVCVINVLRGEKPIYTKDNKFYIRDGNQTIELNLNEIHEYIKNNFE